MSWYKATKLSVAFCILGQNRIAQIKVSSFRKLIYQYYSQNQYFINDIPHYLKSRQGATHYPTQEKVFIGYRQCKEQLRFD